MKDMEGLISAGYLRAELLLIPPMAAWQAWNGGGRDFLLLQCVVREAHLIECNNGFHWSSCNNEMRELHSLTEKAVADSSPSANKGRVGVAVHEVQSSVSV